MTYIDPRAKLFRHLDKLQSLRDGQRAAPVNVEIDLSNRCSHGCAWCHFAYTHTRGPLAGKQDKPAGAIAGGDLMTLDLARSILDQLAAAGVKSVTWTGGGEPTLHPHFAEVIEYAAGVGLEQGIYTHGGHLTPALAALLKRHCAWVFVSLDECDADSFKASKGVDRFGHVLDGIRNLVAATGPATVGVGFLLHALNWTDMHRMVRLGKTLRADYVQFRPTVHFEQATPAQLVEDTAWIAAALAHLRVYAADAFVIADLERFRMYQEWSGHGYATCNWSALQTVITPNGKVWRCTNKREQPDAMLGDLAVETFADLWARSGGPCAVNANCRVLCRGHIANLTLDGLMADMPHSNFI